MLISGTNSTNASANGSSGVMKNFMAIRMMNRLNMLLSVQSQSIQNKGEISGIKQQQQNALETQEDNEEEYQKEHRHRFCTPLSVFLRILLILSWLLSGLLNTLRKQQKRH